MRVGELRQARTVLEIDPRQVRREVRCSIAVGSTTSSSRSAAAHGTTHRDR
ncbi:MAG: hypothetical protein R2713_08965 [Ilumatobacteraceae bacterium]